MSESAPGQVEVPGPPGPAGLLPPETADHAGPGAESDVEASTDNAVGAGGDTDEGAVGSRDPGPTVDARGEADPGADHDDTDRGPPDNGRTGPDPAWTPRDPVPSGPVMGDYRMALVAAVNVDLPNQHPTVVLRESESPRRQLSFSIGFQDAVVLTHAMRRIPTPRPLTHELMSQVLQGFDIDVVAVRLVGRQGAVYFAELDLRGRTGRSVHSCRPSDGLTVALLQPVSVPILIDRRLFEIDGDVIPPGPAMPAPE